MVIDGTRIMFEPGPTVYSIETVFESRVVVLSGFPVSTSQDALHALLTPLNGMKTVMYDWNSKGSTARLEFNSARAASEAAKFLDKRSALGTILLSRVDCATISANIGMARSTKVKVSWFKPSRIAWAHYDQLSEAKRAAKRLQSRTFDNQRLIVKLQTPTARQRESFSVEIKGLPLHFSSEDLRRFCGAEDLTKGSASFDQRNSVKLVEGLLRKYGDLESFEIAPDKPKSSKSLKPLKPSESPKSSKLVAFAQFREWKSAEAACESLNQQPQAFLKYSQLMVQNIHAIRYNLPRPQYLVLKRDLNALERRQPPGCKLRIYDNEDDEDKGDIICLRGYSTELRTLALLKISIEHLLRGEELAWPDGRLVWDDQLTTIKYAEKLSSLMQKFHCWIKVDTRRRKLSIFGHSKDRSGFKQAILKEISAASKQRHTVRLEPQTVRALVAGGIQELKDAFNIEMAQLDIRQRTLTIEGSEDILVKVQRQLQKMSKPSLRNSGSECPGCLCEVVDPTTLTCGHSYCSKCLTSYLQSQSQNRIPDCLCFFRRGGTPCNKPISHQLIRKLLKPEEEERLFRAIYLAYVHSRPQQFLHCPTPDCPTIYRPNLSPSGNGADNENILRCPTCFVKICASCRVEYHEGTSCTDYQLQVKTELAIIDQWKDELDIRDCPSCKMGLQKLEGCNHVQCTQCGVHICWLCGVFFSEKTDKTIYQHMSIEHKGYWLVKPGAPSASRSVRSLLLSPSFCLGKGLSYN